MLKTLSLVCVLGLALVIIGCSKEEEKKAPPVKADAPKVDAPKVDVPKIDVPKIDAPKVDVPKVDAPKVDVPKVDVPKVDPAAATTEAQGLVAKIQQNIADKKWDDAEAALKKLEGMKASLPADWAAKIDALRASFTTAKGAGDLPALPGLPK